MCLAPCRSLVGTFSVIFICLTTGVKQENIRQFKKRSNEAIRANTAGYDQVNITHLKLELSRLSSISTSYQRFNRQNKPSSKVLLGPKVSKTTGDVNVNGFYDERKDFEPADEYQKENSEPVDKRSLNVFGNRDLSKTLRDNEADIMGKGMEDDPQFYSSSKFLDLFPADASTKYAQFRGVGVHVSIRFLEKSNAERRPFDSR
jgi:hypothetical protein